MGMGDVRGIGVDPDKFEAFYREHLESVEHFVARRVGDPHLAADLTADVFLAVIEGSSNYRPELGSPRAWLFGIARNVVSGECRRSARDHDALLRYGNQADLQPDAVARVVQQIDAAAKARKYLHRVQTLPERLRAVLELVAIDDMSITDAAAALQISPGAARVRLHRARQRLSKTTGRLELMPTTGGA